MVKTMQNGNYLVGRVVGIADTPWSSDPSKFNTVLGIAQSYKDKFGIEQTSTVEVSVSPNQKVKIDGLIKDLKDKVCMVPIGVKAMVGGKNGAWSKFFLRDGEFKALA